VGAVDTGILYFVEQYYRELPITTASAMSRRVSGPQSSVMRESLDIGSPVS
jgi:hypothetical protein